MVDKSSDPLKPHQQLIVVRAKDCDSFQGILQKFERMDDGSWLQVGSEVKIVLGRTGLAWGIGLPYLDYPLHGTKVEGDYKSPMGIFSLGTSFGHSSKEKMSQLRIDYLALNSATEAVDDPSSRYYNQIVHKDEVDDIDWQSSEKMGFIPLYEYGLVINHNNPDAKPGLGSAIFMHLWRHENSPTAGCTAMSADSMVDLLHWLDRSKNPILAQFSEEIYKEVQPNLGLPVTFQSKKKPDGFRHPD